MDLVFFKVAKKGEIFCGIDLEIKIVINKIIYHV